AEIGVLRREGRLRIDTRHCGVDGFVRSRIEVNMSRLADRDMADLALRNKATQVNLAEIEHGHNRRSCLHHFAWLSRAGDHGTVEGRSHDQVPPVLLGLKQCRTGASFIGYITRYVRLLLSNLL